MAYKAPLANTLIPMASQLDTPMKEATTTLIQALAAQQNGRRARRAKPRAKSALDIMFQLFCYHLQVSPYYTEAAKSIKQEFARFQTQLDEALVPEFQRQVQVLRTRFDVQIGLIEDAVKALATPQPPPPPPPPPKSKTGKSANAPRSDFVLRPMQRQLTTAEVSKILESLKDARKHWCGPPVDVQNELSESPVSDEPAVLQQVEPLRSLTTEINRIGVRNAVDNEFVRASVSLAALSSIQIARREVRARLRKANSEPNLTKDALGQLRNALSCGLPSFAKVHAVASFWNFGKQSTRATQPTVSAGFVVFLSGLAVVACKNDWHATYPTQADWFKWASVPTCSGKTEFARSDIWCCHQLEEIKSTWTAASEKLQRVTPNGQTLIDRMSGTEHLLTVLSIAVLALAPQTTTVYAANAHSLGSWCRESSGREQILSAAREHGRNKSLRQVVRPPELDTAIANATHWLLDKVKACNQTWWDVALASKWLESPAAKDSRRRCPDKEYVIPLHHRNKFATLSREAERLRNDWLRAMTKRWCTATNTVGDAQRVEDGKSFLAKAAATLQAPPDHFAFKGHSLNENCHVTQLYGSAYGDQFERIVAAANVQPWDAACFARFLLLTPYCDASWTERRWFVQLPGGKHFRKHLLKVTQNYTTFNAHHAAASH